MAKLQIGVHQHVLILDLESGSLMEKYSLFLNAFFGLKANLELIYELIAERGMTVTGTISMDWKSLFTKKI